MLGHSHEVRSVPAGPVGRYYNSGAAGRYQRLLWALELTEHAVEVVAWHIESDGHCQRYTFDRQESELFSFFTTMKSEVRV